MSSKVKETLSVVPDDGWVRITFFAAQDQLGKSSALSFHHSKTYISTGGSSVLVRSSEESELSEDSTVNTVEAILSTWHDGKKWSSCLSKLALHCTCNLHSVCIVLVTGWLEVTAWMMMNWWLMTVTSQSVQKHTYNKNMLYIVLNQKILLLYQPALCSMLQHTYYGGSKLSQHDVPKPTGEYCQQWEPGPEKCSWQ